jgi:hypothetical protein
VGEFNEPYELQLIRAIKMNHDVQLHLHPHWLTSSFSDGVFVPSGDFKLADFANLKYPHNIKGIVENAVSYLSNICQSENNDYRCIAYRGGGFNLEPETREILSALYSAGIRFDSSICHGYYYSSTLSTIDYSDVPSAPNWYISGDTGFRIEANRGIFEIPIASKSKSLFEVPTLFKLKKYLYRAPEDAGWSIHQHVNGKLPNRIRQLLSTRMLNFDNYTYSVDFLIKILQHYANKYKNHESIFVSGIGHPKSMRKYSFELLSGFVEKARKRYGSEIEFITYSALNNKTDFPKT